MTHSANKHDLLDNPSYLDESGSKTMALRTVFYKPLAKAEHLEPHINLQHSRYNASLTAMQSGHIYSPWLGKEACLT